MTDKKYVFVLAHGDMWGAFNANQMVPAIKALSCEPVLIVSRSSRAKDGSILTKVKDFVISRTIREDDLHKYFGEVDKMYESGTATKKPYNLTFDQLAKTYCAEDTVRYTSRGGPKGGEDVENHIKELEAKGIKPEFIMSVDTMAILTKWTAETYDCIGTHPAPLPEIAGMFGTTRSLLNGLLFDREGNRLEKDTGGFGTFGSYGAMAHTKGSLFHLDPKLDGGPVIEFALAPCIPGMCLTQIRSELYHSLVQTAIKHLPEFIDTDKRKALLAEVHAKKPTEHKHEEVPDIDALQIIQWQKESFGFEGNNGTFHVSQNTIMDSNHFKNMMRHFYPGKDEKAFEQLFNNSFATHIFDMEKQKPPMKVPQGLEHVVNGSGEYNEKDIVPQNTLLKRNFGTFLKLNRLTEELAATIADNRKITNFKEFEAFFNSAELSAISLQNTVTLFRQRSEQPKEAHRLHELMGNTLKNLSMTIETLTEMSLVQGAFSRIENKFEEVLEEFDKRQRDFAKKTDMFKPVRTI